MNINNNYRIAFAISRLNNGGAERVISVLASSFAEQGYVTYLINNCKSDGEYPLNENVVRRFLEYPNLSEIKPLSSLQRIKRFREICKRDRIDVVISFMGMSNIAIKATIGLNTKVIVSLRNDPNWIYPNKIESAMVKFLFSFADGGVFQTKQALDWASSRLRNKSRIILNPISSRFFDVEYRPIPKRIVATGRLVKQKNYEMMLKAFALVCKRYSDVHLNIYGQGPEEPILKEMAIKLDINDNVEFCGISYDVPGILSTADLFLLSSNVEGLPNGMMEAMSVGVPCISTDCPCGGPEMLLGNNERGLLVPLNDIDRMAESICLLLENQSLKEEFSRKSLLYAKRFHEDNVINEWIMYINTIIGIENA